MGFDSLCAGAFDCVFIACVLVLLTVCLLSRVLPFRMSNFFVNARRSDHVLGHMV